MLPRLYRLGLLAAAAGLMHVASLRPGPADEISLAAARVFFPQAARLTGGNRQLGGQTVVDARGQTLGLVLTTSPHTDDVVGYAGPSNLLIALDAEQRVIGVRLLTSGDTQAHVDQVKASAGFWQQFAGWGRQPSTKQVDGVSGSTLTSLAMAEAIARRLGGPVTSLRFPDAVTLDEAKSLFADAAELRADQPRVGWHRVLDAQGGLLGFAVRTSPFTDNGRGYRGPTESLVGVGPDGKTVIAVKIRKSYDTPDYVERVQDDDDFFRLLTGRTIDEWAELDFAREGIEGVSGATQTSFAVADGLKRRFAADQSARAPATRSVAWNPGLLAVIGGALVMTFSPLRTSRRLRTVWQGVLIVVFLFWLGDLLSLALVAGWSRHGVPWHSAPSVVLLVAVALVVPWVTRKQIYCQSLCPHGAAQTWLGRFKRLHVRLPGRVHRGLVLLRPALLALGVGLAVFWLSFDLAWLEPFDGWVLKSAAAVSATIAAMGLIASLFVPLAYCRYGCPTGELLSLVKSGGRHDRLSTRDWLAGGLIVVAAGALFGPRLIDRFARQADHVDTANSGSFGGEAFGTTWSVKLRGPHDAAALEADVTAELERIESTLSHWRPDSLTSQFNSSETTLAVEYPSELIEMVAKAQELSRLTAGAYDITVAPLVDAWGYGPSGKKDRAPSEEEIARLLEHTGWEKLVVDRNENTLKKTHPGVQIDLGSLLQGYAADRVAGVLMEAGIAEFLVEVGGELLARGAWEVAIEDPADAKKTLRRLALRDQALATSGFYRATGNIDGVVTHHLISPKTGRPAKATASLAVVVAGTALEADAWSTALLALGLPDGLQLAEEQSLTALLLDTSGGQHTTSRAASLLGHR